MISDIENHNKGAMYGNKNKESIYGNKNKIKTFI